VRIWLYIALGLLTAFAIASAIAYSIPSADDLSPYNPLWNGLAKLASYTNASIIAYSDARHLNAETSALFIIGLSKNLTAEDVEALRSFVENGGILVLADERVELNSILKGLGIGAAVNGSLVADKVFFYKTPFLPVARASIAQHNLSLYLNYASYLNTYGGGRCIAYTSPYSFADLDMDGSRNDAEPYGPFCIAYLQTLGKGVVYVISDSSPFINSMIDLGDNKLLPLLLANGRGVYIAYEQVVKTPYTAFRSTITGFYTAIFGTWLRYPMAMIIGLSIYWISKSLLKNALLLTKSIFSQPFKTTLGV